MSTRTVLVALFMHVFQTMEPIRNEPSFERRTDPDYNTFLRFATMKFATPDSVRSGPLREWAESRRQLAKDGLTAYVASLREETPGRRHMITFGGSLHVDFGSVVV